MDRRPRYLYVADWLDREGRDRLQAVEDKRRHIVNGGIGSRCLQPFRRLTELFEPIVYGGRSRRTPTWKKRTIPTTVESLLHDPAVAGPALIASCFPSSCSRRCSAALCQWLFVPEKTGTVVRILHYFNVPSGAKAGYDVLQRLDPASGAAANTPQTLKGIGVLFVLRPEIGLARGSRRIARVD